jgi:hypothetical protein
VETGIRLGLYGEPTERAQHEASSLINTYKNLVSDAVAQQPIRMNPQKHDLQRLQANRRAEGNAPPPVAVHISVVSREDLRKWLCFVKKELSSPTGNNAPFLAVDAVAKDRAMLRAVQNPTIESYLKRTVGDLGTG